jgi:hypothetical protein
MTGMGEGDRLKLHPNIAIVRRFYAAFIAQDTTRIWEFAGHDLAFHVPGRSRWAGHYRGREELLKLFVDVGRAAGNSVRLTVHDVVGGEEHAVGLHRLTASREGRSLDINGTAVCHVHAGKISEMWIGWQSQRTFDEFWG